MTAATQPSVEELVLDALPWIPRIRLHNAFLSYENGDEFIRHFRRAAQDQAGRLILVVEGSIPDEHLSGDGYWATFGTDDSGQPIRTTTWIDQLAPNAWAVVAAGVRVRNIAAAGGVGSVNAAPLSPGRWRRTGTCLGAWPRGRAVRYLRRRLRNISASPPAPTRPIEAGSGICVGPEAASSR